MRKKSDSLAPDITSANPTLVVPEKTLLVKVAETLAGMPARWSIFITVYSIAVIGLADFLTRYQLGFSRFYLIPILLIAWSVGRRAGVLTATVVSFVWLLADYLVHPWYAGKLLPFWNGSVRLGFLLITVYLLAGLRDALKIEQSLGRTDFLTGVANRRYFFELANAEINRSRRYAHAFIVAYVDIDNFKTVNDRYGHAAGDALLRLVAQTIKSAIRTVDIVARLGGDEFAVLLPETGSTAAADVMKKVHANLSSAMKSHRWPVTFSIGTVTYVHPPASVDAMIKRADTLMYAVKNSGKNTIQYEVLNEETSLAN